MHFTVIVQFESSHRISIVQLQFAQQDLLPSPFAPLVAGAFGKAGRLYESLVPGTSILGFTAKKLLGLKMTFTCSTGITGQSSGRGMCVVPLEGDWLCSIESKQKKNAYRR